MSKARTYARNLLVNWFSYVANIVVMFFLTPFVVHELGKTGYGVWSLLISLTGYLGLIDIGVRAGLSRFINFYLGRKDIPKVNAVVSTAMGYFLGIGLVIVLASVGLAAMLGVLFQKIPADMLPAARIAVVLAGLNIVLILCSALFSHICRAFDRFDLEKAVVLVSLAVRVAGTVLVLKMGGGLAGLACIAVTATLTSAIGQYMCARHVFPELRVRPSLVSRERFREMFGFGVWAFLGNIASKLLYVTDNIVIAVLLGPDMVTFYAIPLMLIGTARGLIYQITSVLAPQMIKAGSTDDQAELRHLFTWGSKVIMLLGIPLLAGLIVLGPEFMGLWIGPDFRAVGAVLILLTIPQFFVLASRSCANLITALGYVKFGASLTFCQAVMNLGLTLVFVMTFGMGLEGVALGTLVPMVIFNTVLLACALRWIHLPPGEYFMRTVLRWIGACGLLAAICSVQFFVPVSSGWAWFAVKAGIMVAVSLPVCWYIVFTSAERDTLRRRMTGKASKPVAVS